MRRWLLGVAVLVLMVDLVAVTGSVGPNQQRASAVGPTTTTTTATTLPPTTAAPPPTTTSRRPVDAPTDSYAPEPIITITRSASRNMASVSVSDVPGGVQ